MRVKEPPLSERWVRTASLTVSFAADTVSSCAMVERRRTIVIEMTVNPIHFRIDLQCIVLFVR